MPRKRRGDNHPRSSVRAIEGKTLHQGLPTIRSSRVRRKSCLTKYRTCQTDDAFLPPLDALRRIPGFENARYEDPYAGGIGNSIRYVGMAPRDDTLKVKRIENLYCAREKAGLLAGHTEAIVTGALAGYNAVRHIKRERPIVLPTTLAIGDAITYVRTQMETEEGLGYKYTFSGSVYFDRMKQKGLYSTDPNEIEKRVDEAGMMGIFSG